MRCAPRSPTSASRQCWRRGRALGLVEPGERAFVVRGDLDPEPPPEPEHDGGRLGWLTGLF